MIVAISHTIEKNRFDKSGRMIEEAGDVVTSHGVDIHTGKTIILPEEPWDAFITHNCIHYPNLGWVLK